MKNNLINIFSKDKVNTGRQLEVDLARGFAALVVIICHVGLYLGDCNDAALYCFSDLIGSEWGAPVFMALMGTSVVFSRHQEPKQLLKRGIILFVGGYILSAFRSIIPWLILGNVDEWSTIAAFFIVDIFQLAGLSFMFLALLKKLKVSSKWILVISLIMVGIGQIMMKTVCPLINDCFLTHFVDLFFPVTNWSCFPFFTWFFFVAFGLFFGEVLTHCNNKDKLYKILLPISLVIVLMVYFKFYLLYPNYTRYYFGNNFYYMGLINVILTAFFITFVLSFWHFINKILPGFIKRFLNFLSKNLSPFYLASWIVVAFLMHYFAYNGGIMLNALEVFITIVITTAICSLAALAYTKIIKKIKKTGN